MGIFISFYPIKTFIPPDIGVLDQRFRTAKPFNPQKNVFTVVANRPRFGCYSPARNRYSCVEVAEGSARQGPAVARDRRSTERGFFMSISVSLLPR